MINGRARFPILGLISLFLGLALIGASTVEIDRAVRAQGQVISSARTQVIQAADGGMLTALYVKEGATVKAGQLLAELESARAEAIYAQSAAEVAARRIALVRARAELASVSPEFTEQDKRDWPAFVDAQEGIFTQRKRSLDSEVKSITASLIIASDELRINRNLLASGDISRTEVMRAERQVLDIQARKDAVINKYFQDTRLEVAKLEDDLSSGRFKIDEKQVSLLHTRLTSPMDGVVKLMKINTVGGVLRAGDELMQISPKDDDLVVQLKVNPVDVAQLTIGLPVTVRFDALDSSIFGGLVGELRYVSPDTISEQGPNGQQQTFYRAEVVLSWADVDSRDTKVRSSEIKPGMTVTADILTGKRTILEFLAKPIFKAFSGSTIQR